MCLLALCMSSLETCLLGSSVLLKYRFFAVELLNSLYILDINPLLDTRFANVFSHLEGCLFILLMVSFGMQKLFSLMWSSLFGAPRWRIAKESICRGRRHKRCGCVPWVEKIPWRRKWQTTPVFLPGKFHGQRSLADYSSWGSKELDMTERTHTQSSSLVFLLFPLPEETYVE